MAEDILGLEIDRLGWRTLNLLWGNSDADVLIDSCQEEIRWIRVGESEDTGKG